MVVSIWHLHSLGNSRIVQSLPSPSSDAYAQLSYRTVLQNEYCCYKDFHSLAVLNKSGYGVLGFSDFWSQTYSWMLATNGSNPSQYFPNYSTKHIPSAMLSVS